MMQNLILLLDGILNTWQDMGLYYAGFAVLFAVLSRKYACNPEMNYWQQGTIGTDLIYSFVMPIFSKYVKLFFLILIVQQLMGLDTTEAQQAYFDHGFGPLATLHPLLQAVLILVISDIILYWTHRLFHRPGLWKIHAIHHSSKVLDWPSAARFHPINVWLTFTLVDIGLLLLGFSPEAFIWLVPFNVFYSAFVHANLNWTLGPLAPVLASPVFHRWHHTSANEGGNKNFAPTFPVLDIIFGTYHMPKGKLPDEYGVSDPHFPIARFIDQLFYPFRK